MPPTAQSEQVRYMQGIAVPHTSVRPQEFFGRTRRKFQSEYSRTYAGLGQQDVVTIKKTDIIAGLYVRFEGDLTVNLAAGTVASTRRWPYDLIRQVRFTANGQSNLINCSGLKLKAREMMARGDKSDRGVSHPVTGAHPGTVASQGTLANASDAWGVGSGVTAIPGAPTVYPVDLTWFVPIAEDQVDLAGAIFAATSSTDLNLTIDWASAPELFVTTGAATATLAGSVQVHALRYSIPLGADGQIVVPDLSLFHSLIQTRHTDFSSGINEKTLVGQGAGKTLLRMYSQLWNGATPQVPVVVNEDNFGTMSWRYSGNETPDEYQDGQILRAVNESQYNSDIGALWGFFSHEFASENAFRDTVDLGTTSEFRQLLTLQTGLALTNPALEVVQESIFSAGAGV